ncbi:MAG: Kdo hydroxylase family protein [Gemmataceae bacterium]
MSDPQSPAPSGPDALEARLERDEVVLLPSAPFPLPFGDDLAFLLRQTVAGPAHKHITFDPQGGELTGFARSDDDGQPARLRGVLAAFSVGVTRWLYEALPRYRGGVEPDRVSFRPEEEATRPLRPNARNDLLHIDAFPTRPARGRRLLRVFVNLNPNEPRVWATSEPLPRLLERHGARMRAIGGAWLDRVGDGLLDLFRPRLARPTAADRQMRRLHDYLKANHEFQERSPRRLWRFPPGAAWLAMTDGCCYAELRGRHALEHSFFVAPAVLLYPDRAPAALLARAA